MTLEEIEDSLPNGFHDARLNSISVDYTKCVATLDLEIWAAESKETDPEVYRPARLTLSDLLLFVIESPHIQAMAYVGKSLWIDAGSDKSNLPPSLGGLIKSLPERAFFHWFFVNDWNAFIYVAAMDAQLVAS